MNRRDFIITTAATPLLAVFSRAKTKRENIKVEYAGELRVGDTIAIAADYRLNPPKYFATPMLVKVTAITPNGFECRKLV